MYCPLCRGQQESEQTLRAHLILVHKRDSDTIDWWIKEWDLSESVPRKKHLEEEEVPLEYDALVV